MTLRAIPAIVLLTALGSGCGGSSSQHSAAAPGSGLPDPQTYAATMDAEERYWWQQPKRVVVELRLPPSTVVVELESAGFAGRPQLAIQSDLET